MRKHGRDREISAKRDAKCACRLSHNDRHTSIEAGEVDLRLILALFRQDRAVFGRNQVSFVFLGAHNSGEINYLRPCPRRPRLGEIVVNISDVCLTRASIRRDRAEHVQSV